MEHPSTVTISRTALESMVLGLRVAESLLEESDAIASLAGTPSLRDDLRRQLVIESIKDAEEAYRLVTAA